MVCHVDGTDYIPLLSVTSSKIIFSGIYNATSVSLDFDSEGIGTLSTTYLCDSNSLTDHTSNKDIHVTAEDKETWNDIVLKKNKDIIVTYAQGSTFRVTHSTQEIYEAVQNGTTVYFQKGTELLNLMEITSSYATFFMFYMSMEGKPQQKVVVITGDSIMLDQDDTYDYATVAQLNNKVDKTALNNYYNKTEVEDYVAEQMITITNEQIDVICGVLS